MFVFDGFVFVEVGMLWSSFADLFAHLLSMVGFLDGSLAGRLVG